MSTRVLDVGNVEGARVLLDVGEDTDSSNIVTSGKVHVSALLKLEDGIDISTFEVKLIINK